MVRGEQISGAPHPGILAKIRIGGPTAWPLQTIRVAVERFGIWVCRTISHGMQLEVRIGWYHDDTVDRFQARFRQVVLGEIHQNGRRWGRRPSSHLVRTPILAWAVTRNPVDFRSMSASAEEKG
jgi:hypothetical protein